MIKYFYETETLAHKHPLAQMSSFFCLLCVFILVLKQRRMDLGSVHTFSEYVTEVTDEEHTVHMLKQSVKRTN